MLLSLVPEIHGRLDAGVSIISSGHAPPTTTIAAPPASSWRSAVEPAARRDPQPGRGDRGHDEQGGAHLRLEAEADAHAREDDPARAPVLQRAHEAPQGADAAQRQQRIGVVVARDRDGDRRDGEHESGDEAGRAPPKAAREVIDERDRGDAHERLGHEDAPRMKAEDPGRERLDPERERRLVHRHQPTGVERVVEEVVPARAHRAHGRAVVLVRPPVAIERPQVQHAREEQEGPELGEGQRPAARGRARARLVEGLRAAAGATGRGRGGRGGGSEPRQARAQGLGNRRHDGQQRRLARLEQCEAILGIAWGTRPQRALRFGTGLL